ncbi:hypothetical protein [Leptolyngbya sp. GGD]|uniref:hypothetical protein n=1 Tax=Leptolyngbya sp. GGD TaxID=2997907 RepID=UPI00227C3BE1|nr:hypothetical protein [Leptolyngbya sp. GGD]MCY6492232.1 hypothetical protein [Leptolyngbya sp. GGD]
MDYAIDWIVKCDWTWRLEIAIVNVELLLRFIRLQPPKSPILGDFEQLESDKFSDRASSIHAIVH